MPFTAHAGAWPQPQDRTQIIISHEPGAAVLAFDADGNRSLPLDRWAKADTYILIDRAVSDRFTVTTKLNLKDDRANGERVSGPGSIELGVRYTLHRNDHQVFALGGGIEGAGQGRRSDVDTLGTQGADVFLRAYAGRSFQIAGMDGFATLELARYLRAEAADQWRWDATFGLKPSPKWLIMAQTFSGQTDAQSWGKARWTHAQLSAVRHFGPDNATSLQLGLRRTVVGRLVPQADTLVVALWQTY